MQMTGMKFQNPVNYGSYRTVVDSDVEERSEKECSPAIGAADKSRSGRFRVFFLTAIAVALVCFVAIVGIDRNMTSAEEGSAIKSGASDTDGIPLMYDSDSEGSDDYVGSTFAPIVEEDSETVEKTPSASDTVEMDTVETESPVMAKGCFGADTVTVHNPDLAYEGYTLLGHVPSWGFQGIDFTYLVDMKGQLVHHWWHPYAPNVKVSKLLENGNLLRLAWLPNRPFWGTWDSASNIQEMDWEGKIVVECTVRQTNLTAHHDVLKTPQGTYMVLAWKIESEQYCLDLGMDPDKPLNRAILHGNANDQSVPAGYANPGCMIDGIIEYKPVQGDELGKCERIWEWWMDDHVVQDYLPENEETYGKPGNHPRKIDLNYWSGISSDDTFYPPQTLHFNSIDYNAHFDQVMASSFHKSELYVLNHSTTTKEASGTGGDLLYRFGNAAAYSRGTAFLDPDQLLFKCHSAHWIEDGLPGAGNIMYFDNGFGKGVAQGREDFSSADEITPPVDAKTGEYYLEQGAAFGPFKYNWTYNEEDCDGGECLCDRFGGAQRLPNGNTLITHSHSPLPDVGFWLIEVTKDGEIVWKMNAPVQWNDWITDLAADTFRAYRYAPGFEGLKGKTLEPYCKANEHDKCFGNDMLCRRHYNLTRNDIPWPKAAYQEVHGPNKNETTNKTEIPPPPYSTHFPYNGAQDDIEDKYRGVGKPKDLIDTPTNEEVAASHKNT